MVTDWKEAVEQISKETERIWLNEPEDVARLASGYVESRAGAYGQYFTTLCMAWASLYGITQNSIFGLAEIVRQEGWTLDQLKKMAKVFLSMNVPDFVEFLGLPTMGRMARLVLDSIDTVKTVDEYKILLDKYSIYCGKVWRWLNFVFPWYLCSSFPQKLE